MSSCSSNAGMDMTASCQCRISNTVSLQLTHNDMLPQIIPILRYFLVESLF